jgi:hypothetical protein
MSKPRPVSRHTKRTEKLGMRKLERERNAKAMAKGPNGPLPAARLPEPKSKRPDIRAAVRQPPGRRL